MNAQNPAPDPDTMLTLIETNDQLNIAMSKHQRSVLSARKAAGLATPSPAPEAQQPPTSMPQHIPGQNVYGKGQPQQAPPDHGPYSASPPRRQATIPTPVSPLRREEEDNFAPPPGPPPSRAPAPQQQSQHQAPSPSSPYDFSSAGSFSNQFSAPQQAPSVPTRSAARPPSHVYSSSADYGVAENPFADDAYGPGSPQKPTAQASEPNENAVSRPPQVYSGDQYPQEMPSEHSRRGPYNANYQSTPSYLHRQESSADHLTMHGGGPPPPTAVSNGNQSYPAGSAYDGPVSPIDETHGVGRRMNDMHI